MNDLNQLPFALDHFTDIERRIEGRPIGVFLDYDGTLTPIADRPELAILSDPMRLLLDNLAGTCPTAIVSGRALQELVDIVHVDNLFYAGSHGFDIVGPTGSGIQHEVGTDFVPVIESAHEQLCARFHDIAGVIVETKRYSLSVHYRLVDERSVPIVEQRLSEVLQGHPTLHKTHGKKVFEVRPRLDWNKGKAVQWILQTLNLTTVNAAPVYIGDDTTDEDAFRAVFGTGIGILVASVPRATAATYRLRDPAEVALLLARIVALRSRLGGGHP